MVQGFFFLNGSHCLAEIRREKGMTFSIPSAELHVVVPPCRSCNLGNDPSGTVTETERIAGEIQIPNVEW